MSSSLFSYLTASFLTSQGFEVNKPLRDWLTRASYLAKNRGSEKEQRKYVYWALRTVEDAARSINGMSSVDWKQLSPVMPAGMGEGPVPEMVRCLEGGGGSNDPNGTGPSRGATADADARTSLLAEVLRRVPDDLKPYVSQAFDLYDRDVVLGKRHYFQVSYLEMVNLAKNLRGRELQRKRISAASLLSPNPTVTTTTNAESGGRSTRPSVRPAPAANAPRPPTEPLAAKGSHTRKRDRSPELTAPRAGPGRHSRWNNEVQFFTELSVGKAEENSESQQGRVFVGSSTDLERNYSRYEPTIEDIRPLPVLYKAFAFICSRAEEKVVTEGAAASLKYLNEQLKGMRQDLRVQNINNNFAVTVYEFHARLCLEVGDLGEFNQCQSALKRLYSHPGVSDKDSCCVSEFFSYRIVYLSLGQQLDALSTELINYTNELASSPSSLRGSVARFVRKPDIHHALRLMAACVEGDCTALLAELQHFPVQMTYLVRIYLQRMRVGWLREILCGVRGTISLRFVMANLGFTPLRVSEKGASAKAHNEVADLDAGFWVDGSREGAEREFTELFNTVKLQLPHGFDFTTEVIRDATRDHAGGSKNETGSVPSLDAAHTREVVETYVAYLGTRKDAIGTSH